MSAALTDTEPASTGAGEPLDRTQREAGPLRGNPAERASQQPRAELSARELERLYVALERPIYNVVYRWLWSPDDARDVVQEAFLRVWDMRDRVRLETVEALLYKIAVNLACNRRRSRKLWRWVSLEAIWRSSTRSSDPAQLLAAREHEVVVARAIESLPERYRRVILLCELTEMTYDQVAEVLAIPAGTVASRRHTALALLRRQFAATEEPHEAD